MTDDSVDSETLEACIGLLFRGTNSEVDFAHFVPRETTDDTSIGIELHPPENPLCEELISSGAGNFLPKNEN